MAIASTQNGAINPFNIPALEANIQNANNEVPSLRVYIVIT